MISLEPAMMGDLVPIVAIFAVFGLPMLVGIIAIVLKHQREMAKLLQNSNPEGVADEIRALRSELRDLKETMMNHALSMDSTVTGLAGRVEDSESKATSLDQAQRTQ